MNQKGMKELSKYFFWALIVILILLVGFYVVKNKCRLGFCKEYDKGGVWEGFSVKLSVSKDGKIYEECSHGGNVHFNTPGISIWNIQTINGSHSEFKISNLVPVSQRVYSDSFVIGIGESYFYPVENVSVTYVAYSNQPCGEW